MNTYIDKQMKQFITGINFNDLDEIKILADLYKNKENNETRLKLVQMQNMHMQKHTQPDWFVDDEQ